MSDLKHDADAMLRFLNVVMEPPGTAVELRAIRARLYSGSIVPAEYKMTLAGWYDNAADLVLPAVAAKGVSVYVTFNPIDPDLLARSYNAIKKAVHTTTDDDITALRWLFIDVDPIRKPDISATNEERALALERRDRILAEVPGLAEASLFGSSGNGAFILARITDRPNKPKGRKLIDDATAIMGKRFDGDGCEIDQKTKNPGRIMCLPGSIKCKGSNVPNRPWRTSTLEGVPSGSTTFDIDSFVAEHAGLLAVETKPTKTSVSLARPGGSSGAILEPFPAGDETAEKIFRARRYLDAKPGAVAGQNGHGKTFDAACTLVIDFDLPPTEAKPILLEWNQRCDPPWEESDLDHKLEQADAKPDERGRLFREQRNGPSLVDSLLPVQLPPGSPPGGWPNAGAGDEDDDFSPCMPGEEDNPHRLAREYLIQRHNHPDSSTLKFWKGEFYGWAGCVYRVADDKTIRGKLAQMLDEEFKRVFIHQSKELAQQGDEGRQKLKNLKKIPVTTTIVGHVVQALSGMVMIDSQTHDTEPCWTGGNQQWPIEEILPMRNAIVHIPSYLEGKPCTQAPTPNLFASYALSYDWTPTAPTPSRWLAFLDGVFPKDPESVQCLQEWFGLQLVPITKFQKMMAFIGPPRAGKGVIAATLRELVGQHNCCGPTLGGLAETFGLQALIGKLTAVIDDARMSARSDQATIMERLLSVSGEGTLDIRRMYRPQWSGVLPTRVTLISNELPRFHDSSNALAERFLVLKFTRSHLGKEDSTLREKFKAELPGILLWSIEGLRRLQARGHFVQPAAGAEIHDEMKAVSSPIGCFVAERCKVGPDEQADKTELYTAWKDWCDENGRKDIGEMNVFFRNLRSAVPDLSITQPTIERKRLRLYKGIGLLPPDSLYDSNESGLAPVEVNVDFGPAPAY